MDTHRQTAVEVLAMAICELFPEAQQLEAHVTDIGYAYDFLIDQPIDSNTLPFIEEKMREIGKRNTPIEDIEMMPGNAKSLFEHHQQSVLASQMDEIESSTLPLIRIGQFFDRTRPGIGKSTADMGFIQLNQLEREESFTRIHGIAFPSKKEATSFLKETEKNKNNSHLILGPYLKLFSFSSDRQPLWLPKGVQLRKRLIQWLEKEMLHKNFTLTYTPPQSFPATKTHDQLFEKKEGKKFTEIGTKNASPLTYPFFRGLLTSESETSDLSSFYCTPENLVKELTSSLQFIEKTLNIFGFEPHWHLITTGRRKTDHKTLLKNVLQECNFIFESKDQEITTPKVEVRIKDAFGQSWPGPWVEIDLKRSLIKSSLLGSLEKMIALIIERHQGQIPMWLAPEPVRIIVVGERHVAYAKSVVAQLTHLGVDAKLHVSSESMGQKVRAALQEKIPCIAVIGDKEEKTNSVTIRDSDNGEINKTTPSFIEEVAKQIKVKI